MKVSGLGFEVCGLGFCLKQAMVQVHVCFVAGNVVSCSACHYRTALSSSAPSTLSSKPKSPMIVHGIVHLIAHSALMPKSFVTQAVKP